MLHAVIMAGGRGTRFWPESRTATPKQLLRLHGDRTMIQQTVDRLEDLVPPDRVWIVTNAEQAAEVRRQLPDVPAGNVIVEPVGRDTAPCVALAAAHLVRSGDDDPTMALMPADHVIRPDERLIAALRHAEAIVEHRPEVLALFGVRPDYPATGFGYIEAGEAIPVENLPTFTVAGFREKPDESTAAEYLDSGRFYWNCGMFVWKADTILSAIAEHEPEVMEPIADILETIGTDDYEHRLEERFADAKKVSIDYAVLERADRIAVIEAPFEWDDIGAWQALPRLIDADAEGNVVDAAFCGVETRDCIVRAPEGHTIATFGVDNLIVVNTPDATLVARRDDESGVKQLVAALAEQGLDHLL